jgi:hypothetical protein
MTADELAAVVGAAAAHELDSALNRIKHCLGQLNDEQVRLRSQPSLNSLGNLILHLCSNVRQWIVAGVGGVSDVRNRPAEFAERGPIPKEELMRRLEAVLEEAKHVLVGVDARQLVEVRRIQGFDVTGAAAIFDTIPHFRGHTKDHPHDPLAVGRFVQVRLDANNTRTRRISVTIQRGKLKQTFNLSGLMAESERSNSPTPRMKCTSSSAGKRCFGPVGRSKLLSPTP